MRLFVSYDVLPQTGLLEVASAGTSVIPRNRIHLAVEQFPSDEAHIRQQRRRMLKVLSFLSIERRN